MREVFTVEARIYENPAAAGRALFFSRWNMENDPDSIASFITSRNFNPRMILFIETPPGIEQSTAATEGAAKVVRFEPERIEIAVDAPVPGLVFVPDSWTTGWEARVDGRPARVLVADYAFRAVPVGAGARSVVMTYRPYSIRLGAVFTFIMMAAGFANLVVRLSKGSHG